MNPKLIIKRIAIVILSSFAVIFIFVPIVNRPALFQSEGQVSVFSNDLFDTNIYASNKANDFITYSELQTVITTKINENASDLDIKKALLKAVDNRRVAIYTADDLYNFSVNVSFNRGIAAAVNPTLYIEMINYLLSLDYVLLNDIDYSSMRSKHFLPIGIYISIPEQEPPTIHDLPFTGTFDGQGYTISNLYLASRDYITMVYRFDDNPLLDEELPLASYYSMFAHVGIKAKISNFIIKNPIWELINAPEGLIQTSILIGENKGLIYNVGVIDERKNASGVDISGIRFNIQYGTSSPIDYTAAGFVHTNYGKIYNSYYISKHVLATSSKSRFNVKPFVYDNKLGGDIKGCSYQNDVELNVDDLSQPLGIKSYTALELKSGEKDNVPINLNGVNLSELTFRGSPLIEKRKWYFYKDDGYPSFDGLEYNGSHFLINDEYDLVIFSSLIQKKTPHLNGKKYSQQTYVLTDNIDMKNIVAYTTPGVLFEGILKGGEGDITAGNQNKYILNLNKITPFITTTEYYYGLVGKLSGTICNINFFKNNLTLSFTDLYTKTGYVGMVAAILAGGTIENVVSGYQIEDPENPLLLIPGPTINLGTMPLGKTYFGGIVGFGTGTIKKVANTGLIHGGDHKYSDHVINPEFYLGGIIGASGPEKLHINNAINKGDLTGFSSSGTYNLLSGTSALIKIGGIIGQVNNQTPTGNTLYYLTNMGTVSAGQFLGRNGVNVKQQVGGIFGNVTGYANRITTDNVVFDNGRWENQGLLKGTYNDIYRVDYLAGIGHASTSTIKAEFSYLINKNGLEYDGFNVGTHNQYVYYASTIMDHSTTGIKLTRAYNDYNYVYGESYFTNSSSLSFDQILIAPFFYSVNDAESDLIYVNNKGNIQVGLTNQYLNATKEMRIAGITLASKVKYLNVTMSGYIDVIKISNNESIYVAGIAWVLAYNKTNKTPYTAINTLFEGKIRTPQISGNTTINASTTPAASANASFVTSLTIRNLYIAGLFNINVGAIINSINRGELTSDYQEGTVSLSHITGTANTYVGGLVTFNYNLIKDSGNIGNIHFTNDSAAETRAAGGVSPGSLSQYGGLIYAFKGGLTLGGLVAAFGDIAALILEDGLNDYGRNGQEVIDGQDEYLIARVFDSSNVGDVYGKAPEYVRSGGILGVALGSELTSGTDNINSASVNAIKVFSTCILGEGDKVSQSEVKNGLNFGNISAITSTIGTYGKTDNTGSGDSSNNSQRPGIYAGAGGVIGYGLCIMQKMLNHGIISSTDVAGGIIGATYILGGTSTRIAVTRVEIDTAVHYGKVRAAINSSYNNFTFETSQNQNYFYPDDTPTTRNTFIFPTNNNYNLAIYPNKKRGFGGIFGRLQRGGYGLMQSNQFINIMNMDESVDMIGRADQYSYNNSIQYFRFSVSGKGDTYYTARSNDTTQAVIVGYVSSVSNRRQITEIYNAAYRITKNRNTYTLNSLNITAGIGRIEETATRTVSFYSSQQNMTSAPAAGTMGVVLKEPFNNYQKSISNITLTSSNYSNYGFASWAEVTNLFSSDGVVNYTKQNNTIPYIETLTKPTVPHQYPVEKITDKPNQTIDYNNRLFFTDIFNSNFPLMQETQSDFIYKANNDVLADRFKNEKVIVDGEELDNPDYRKYGMYVLATEKGRKNGAVLPLNINISKFFKLNEATEDYINLDNVPNNRLLSSLGENPIIVEYQSMFQTRFYDKSYVLSQSSNSNLADIVLYDPSGNSPTLTGGTIDNINQRITFTVSRDAFSSNNVTYQVLSATLSEKAVIAVSGINQINHSGFKLAYNNRTSNILDGDYQSQISMILNVGLNTFPQKITVYSEIACQIDELVEDPNYKTNYTIVINYVNTALGITFDSIAMNDGTPFVPPTPHENLYSIDNPKLLPDGKIVLTFRDSTYNLLPLGHQITFVGLFYQGDSTEIVPNDYYSVIKQGKDQNRYFSLTLTLSDQLRGGNYLILYSYYNNTTVYTVSITKESSTASFITSVNYDTYSFDSSGLQFGFEPTNVDFTTYLGFGIELSDIVYDSETPLNFEVVEFDVENSFVNKNNYYLIKSGPIIINKIALSPFAELLSVKASYNFNSEKLKYYTLKYEIKTEAKETETINHTILERSLPKLIVYNNGNLDLNRPVPVPRENFETLLELDFGFPHSKYNLAVTSFVKKGNEIYSIINSEIELKNNHEFYHIIVKYALEAGEKEFIFTLDRGNCVLMQLGSLFIKKIEGKTAYLWDINFQIGSDLRIIHPIIYEANSDGSKKQNSHYDMRLYYDGIDYNSADFAQVKYFRIDGLVSDIDLEAYSPEFFLPAGAKIYRKDQNGNWTEDLFGSFLGEDEELAIVEYKVVPENGEEENVVYYFITAEDLIYNLTIRFTLYYQFKDGLLVEASDANSPIKDRVILIAVRNFGLLDLDENEQPIIYQTIDDDGHLIYPFEGNIINYITGMNNQSTMFYFPTNYTKYIYTFARNLSGCYGFTIVTPLYQGQTIDDLVNGERYSYDIYLKHGLTSTEEDPYPWHTNNRLLPNLDETGSRTGKYFFIEGSTDKNRIRDFAIVINEDTVGTSWGLSDDKTSWDQINN